MISMKMRLWAIIICAATLFSLAACGSGETTPTPEADSMSDFASAPATEATSGEASEATTESEVESTSDTERKDESSDSVADTETTAPDVDVKVDGDSATVTNASGLSYVAKGFSSANDDAFTFVKDLSFSFDNDTFADKFNRFSLTYSSTAPLHIYVTYKSGSGAKQVDDYYLEAGNHVFSGIIVDYMNNKKGMQLSNISVDTCKGEKATFTLYNLETEMSETCLGNGSATTYYIDNGRFKIGIDMGWGGTVNYVEDLTQNIPDLTNLINKHDTGRLVQQSYYGTGEQEGIDFEWGKFNGSDKWPYNPVQGGGQGNTASRLIDVEVGENYIYIKAQPMDWGKVGVITPSYMENKYILEEDYIRVDNRFVDFSGWIHPTTGQELPAFYTVSYLDTFVWYDGSNPWTGEALSSRDDLNFWGDSKYSGDCTFPLRENNTETWCAWVNTDEGFGVGLYVPNIDLMKAGRFAYNGSKSATNNATNYVAPINSIKLVAYEPLEYSYLITTGTTDEIRATFAEHKDFATNASLHKNYVSLRIPNITFEMSDIDFTIDESYKVFTAPNNAEATYDAKEKATKLTMTDGDPYLHLNFILDDNEYFANDYSKIEIVYMIPESNANSSYACQMFTCTGQQTAADASMVVDGRLTKDGKYHTLTFDVEAYSFWTGKINQLRFDFFNGGKAGDVMYVKSIKLIESENSGEGSVVAEDTRLDFSHQGNVAVFSNPNNTNIGYDEVQKTAKFTVTEASDVYAAISFKQFGVEVMAEDYPKIKLVYMIPKTNGLDSYRCDLFLCAGNIMAPTGEAFVRSDLIADGEYHTLEIDLSDNSFWKGVINMIRVDYFDLCESGDVFYLKSIEIAQK